MRAFALHPEAFRDLSDLADHIAAYSVDAAHRVVDDLFAAFQDLVAFPNLGRRRPDLTSRPLRFLIVRDYLIAYAPDEDPLWILAVLDGRSNPRVMAAILREREE